MQFVLRAESSLRWPAADLFDLLQDPTPMQLRFHYHYSTYLAEELATVLEFSACPSVMSVGSVLSFVYSLNCVGLYIAYLVLER